MPSPVGHALGGLAAGWLLEPRTSPAAHRRATLAFAALGSAADLDLLLGAHRGPSHGVGAALVVGLAAWVWLRRRRDGARLALACAAAYGSHILLDCLGSDSSPPIGLQALWPFSSHYYQASWQPFLAVSRRIFQPGQFWLPNVLALARELLILLPLAAAAGHARRRQARRALTATVGVALCLGTLVAHQGRLAAATPQWRIESAPPDSPYLRAIAAYGAGDFAGALALVAAMPEADVSEQAAHLEKGARAIEAAAMLHTELALRSFAAPEPRIGSFHLTRARRLVQDLKRLQSPGEFQRGWYLFLSAGLQEARALDEADHLLAEAREVFPHDPDLLLASGAAFELRALTPNRTLPALRPGGRIEWQAPDGDREVRRALASSVKCLVEATALAPGDDEARLRLGDVLHRTGQADRAVAELEVVRRRSADPAIRYLAATFEGAVESGRGRPERAAPLFLEALGAARGQAAAVGLSAAYYDQGRTVEAGRALQDVLHPSLDVDPWLAYLAGDAWHLEPRRAAMRALTARR